MKYKEGIFSGALGEKMGAKLKKQSNTYQLS